MRNSLPVLCGLVLVGICSAQESPQAAKKAGFAEPDYKPLIGNNPEIARPHGNLDITSRRFGILKAKDPHKYLVTLLLDGESDTKEWPVRLGAEIWRNGWWGRLDQFDAGDRVWVWFDKDLEKQPARISLLADELSEQVFYAPFEVKALTESDPIQVAIETTRGKKPWQRNVSLPKENAPDRRLKVGNQIFVQTNGDTLRVALDSEEFEKRRAEQKTLVRNRWSDEGLPGSVIFTHPERGALEVMLDHEAIQWSRSLRGGDEVTLHVSTANSPNTAIVRQIRPWRERTQILLDFPNGPSNATPAMVGQRIFLRLANSPKLADDKLPTLLDRSQSNAERVEWVMASIYCTCGMHDVCAGHVFTLAACDGGPGHTCGLARDTRKKVAEQIDQGQTDRQVFENLLKERGPNLARPHMLP